MNTILKLLLALTLSAPVAAQQCTTLVYTGAPFTSLTSTPNSYIEISSPIAGTITLAVPLAMNGTAQAVTPTLWALNNGAYGDSHLPGPTAESFVFTTVNGVITDWKITFSEGFPRSGYEHYYISATIAPAGDSLSASGTGECCGPNDPGPASFTGSNASAGKWACQTTDPLAATVADQAATIAVILKERDTYVDLYRVLITEMAQLEAQR
jgi:hypothetical protein